MTVPRPCTICGRKRGEPEHEYGLCNLAELDDGRLVHVSRIDNPGGDLRQAIEEGRVRVKNRWRKKSDPKKKEGR